MRVLSLGNYALDEQESMLRFAALMRELLPAQGIELLRCDPAPVLGQFGATTKGGFGKWLGYFDKYAAFLPVLARALRRLQPDLVHIADHSNSVYVPWIRRVAPQVRVVVTAHDLLAIRYALEGADPEYQIGFTGRTLQSTILKGLRQAHLIVCDSGATRADAERMVQRGNAEPALRVVHLSLNHPYRALPRSEAAARLRAAAPQVPLDRPWFMHIGSDQLRKNRPLLLRLLAALRDEWNGVGVFAGARLNPGQHALARELGVADRIVEVPGPSEDTLEALYSHAVALVFPSRGEGYGWPVLEAQACDCPVICSDVEPLPEVAGPGGARIVSLHDLTGYVTALREVSRDSQALVTAGRANVAQHTAEVMIRGYLSAFQSLRP